RLPHASVAVQFTVAEPVPPQRSPLSPYSSLFLSSPQVSELIAPPLLANQVLRSAVFPLPSHSAITSLASASITGAVVSSIVKVADVELEFPQASVAVKVTVAAPVAPQRSLSALKSFDQEIAEQSSVAVAPPLLANQSLRSAVFPAPSHSTVKSLASVSITGAVVS